MKQINYKVWANIVRLFLFVGIFFQLLASSLSIIKDVFNLETDFSFERFEYGYRNYKKGYPVKTTMYLEIPDTVIRYEKGTIEPVFGRGMAYDWYRKQTANRLDTIINKIKPQNKYLVSEKELKEMGPLAETDSTGNRIAVLQPVSIRVKTNDTFHRWFYIAYDQLDKLFMVLIFIWLIKLINSYLKGTFLNPRSFDLITRIGYSFIWMNIICGVFRMINTHVQPEFDLISSSKTTGHLVNNLKLTLVPNHLNMDITYILIGVSILILSDIIKNAIFIKKEQDLTI